MTLIIILSGDNNNYWSRHQQPVKCNTDVKLCWLTITDLHKGLRVKGKIVVNFRSTIETINTIYSIFSSFPGWK